MILVLQSFGNEKEYRRAVFSILSFYAVSSDKISTFLFTDNPFYFEDYFDRLPIKYFMLSKEDIAGMRGKIDFLHRIKIAVIARAFETADDAVLYVDSDTFFFRDPIGLFMPSKDRSYMHLSEYAYSSLRGIALPAGESFRRFLELIEANTFKLTSGEMVTISPGSYSWNAGVMILDRSVRELLPDVFTLTDQFYPPTGNHASEQYAFSVVLQHNTRLASCDSAVYHYWHRVKKQIMDAYLEELIKPAFGRMSSHTKFESVRSLVARTIRGIDNHVLILRDNAVQQFNEDHYFRGYWFALKALIRGWDGQFVRDVMYHTKRLLTRGN